MRSLTERSTMLNLIARPKRAKFWFARVVASIATGCVLVGGLMGTQAFAQSAFKPTGPVKIVVMFPPCLRRV